MVEQHMVHSLVATPNDTLQMACLGFISTSSLGSSWCILFIAFGHLAFFWEL